MNLTCQEREFNAEPPKPRRPQQQSGPLGTWVPAQPCWAPGKRRSIRQVRGLSCRRLHAETSESPSDSKMVKVHALRREGERSSENKAKLSWEKKCFWSWFSSHVRNKNSHGCVLLSCSRDRELHSQPNPVPWSRGYASVHCVTGRSPPHHGRRCVTWAPVLHPLKTLTQHSGHFPNWLVSIPRRGKLLSFFHLSVSFTLICLDIHKTQLELKFIYTFSSIPG